MREDDVYRAIEKASYFGLQYIGVTVNCYGGKIQAVENIAHRIESLAKDKE